MSEEKVLHLSPNESQGLLQDKAILLDVREQAELSELSYSADSLVHIPMSEVDAKFSELPKDKLIIVACKSGGRSLRIANFLSLHNYRVANLDGGMIRWAKEGFPTKGDSKLFLQKYDVSLT